VQAYDGVLGRNADGDIIDALATDYERLEDGRVRFEIRDGVTFHNGDELQPSDIAYSVNRVVDPEVGISSPQNDQLAGVTGAEVVDGGVEVTSDGSTRSCSRFSPRTVRSFSRTGSSRATPRR